MGNSRFNFLAGGFVSRDNPRIRCPGCKITVEASGLTKTCMNCGYKLNEVLNLVAGTRKERIDSIAASTPTGKECKISRAIFIRKMSHTLGLREITIRGYLDQLIEVGIIKTNHFEVWKE